MYWFQLFSTMSLEDLHSVYFLRQITFYIDPNTGGLLFQVLAGIFAFFSAFVLIFSRQIKILVARLRRYLSKSENEQDEDTDSGI